MTQFKSILNKINNILPEIPMHINWEEIHAARWTSHRYFAGWLEPINASTNQGFNDLKGIHTQIEKLKANLDQFTSNQPCNSTLLWGARGTGKSSLIKVAIKHYASRKMRLIEVSKENLADLPKIVQLIKRLPYFFVIFCDDLSFEIGETEATGLRSILDGTVETFEKNIIVIATSNRRHIIAEPASDNLLSTSKDSELHYGDVIENRIALSDRFGLWLSFPPFNQSTYLAICEHWFNQLAKPQRFGGWNNDVAIEAANFAISRGSRGGRIAKHFVINWLAEKRMKNV